MITAAPADRLPASILIVVLLAAGSPCAGGATPSVEALVPPADAVSTVARAVTPSAGAVAPMAEVVSPVAEEAASSLQQDTEPLTEEQARADSEVRSRLQALYDRIESLRDVTVDVEAGIVRLRGEALSLEARQRAVALAQDAEGVVFVEDDLRVATDLTQRLEPAMDRIREYAFGAVAFLPLLLVALLILVGFVVLGRWIARWDGPHLRFATTPFTRGLLRQGIRFAFTIFGLLVALELLDATALVGAVLGAAGVFGLAVGFAFKDIVENHLAGVMLSLRQPFSPNDHIVVGSHEGKVIRLTARETILMTLSGNHVRIPNAELYRTVMTNYTRNPRRRFDFSVSVGTDDDLLEAQEAGLGALRTMTGVMADPPPTARVAELGDSWVTLQFFGWVDQQQADFGRVRSEAVRLVKLALEDAGVSMPSPEYAVRLKEPEAAEGAGVVDGDRAEGTRKARRRGERGPDLEAREPERDAEQQDVSVDHTLDEQIEEDRRVSDEGDLLAEEPGSGEES